MKSRIRFGIDVRRQLTGADLYMRIFQICALLPLPYLFLAWAHPVILETRNPVAAMFDIGICALPRVEAFALSCFYRAKLSEMTVYFVILIIAIALGFAAVNILRGNPEISIRMHRIFAVLIACDLVIRLIPVKANIAFGLPAAIAGFAARAVCLWLIMFDLKAYKAETKAVVQQ